MISLILTVFVISLITTGIYATTWKGMIFHEPAKYLERKLPIWICKPLFICPICMSSVWGIVFFCCFGFPELLILPVVILMVAGLNTIIVSIISNIIPDEND